MHVLAEWVLVFEQSVVVGVLGDSTAVPLLLVFRVLWNKRFVEPTNLLGGRLLPLGTLLGQVLAIEDALLHRLLFEDALNSGRVEIDLT